MFSMIISNKVWFCFSMIISNKHCDYVVFFYDYIQQTECYYVIYDYIQQTQCDYVIHD